MGSKARVLFATGLIALLASQEAAAGCASDPLLGSICMVGFNFCPRGYADASGQLMAISQNSALFSLLGTTYGGDGRTTFALPDLRGRVPVGDGTGPGLSAVRAGDRGGSEQVTLSQAQMPSHTHTARMNAARGNGDVDEPASAAPARMPRTRVYGSGAPSVAMGTDTVTVNAAGGGQAVAVRDPYLGMRYCIATVGIFPSRN
jgi:microcystin-dependent protein